MDTVTARKAMVATINLLSEINVPMSMFDNIGVPVKHAINNLYIGLDALKEEETEIKEADDGKTGVG